MDPAQLGYLRHNYWFVVPSSRIGDIATYLHYMMLRPYKTYIFCEGILLAMSNDHMMIIMSSYHQQKHF